MIKELALLFSLGPPSSTTVLLIDVAIVLVLLWIIRGGVFEE